MRILSLLFTWLTAFRGASIPPTRGQFNRGDSQMSWKSRTLTRLMGLELVVALCAPRSTAQTLGNVTQVIQLTQGCPTNRNFDPNPNMACYSAWLSSCPNADDLQFVYGVLTPPAGTRILGTIVMLAGDGGVNAEINSYDTTYAEYYLSKGYQVVQIA